MLRRLAGFLMLFRNKLNKIQKDEGKTKFSSEILFYFMERLGVSDG
jgi:hypothetical protein